MSDQSSPDPTSTVTALDMEHGERWVPVASLLRPQGRRGELLCDPLTDQSEVFEAGQRFRLAQSEIALPSAPSVTLEACWRPLGRNAGRLVLKLVGVDSIAAAEALEGQQLFLPAAALPALAPGTYLVRDLIDCELFDGDRLLGTVTDLQFPIDADGRTRLPDAADLLVLHRQNSPSDTDPVLIPFVKAWLVGVNLEKKQIHMQLPEGLFDHPSE